MSSPSESNVQVDQTVLVEWSTHHYTQKCIKKW
jgi:hypothetical protein